MNSLKKKNWCEWPVIMNHWKIYKRYNLYTYQQKPILIPRLSQVKTCEFGMSEDNSQLNIIILNRIINGVIGDAK